MCRQVFGGHDSAHVLARMLVEHGRIPVLECTYSRREQRASLTTVLADLPAVPMWVVEFAVSPEDAVQRFRRRHQDTDLDEQLVRERAETFPYSEEALRLESSGASPGDLASRISGWLRDRPGSVQRDLWMEAGKGWD